jgi:hypothetical protein
MFRKAQDISVGVFEPGNFSPGWSDPDARCILTHAFVAFESDTCQCKCVYGVGNILNLPSQDGAASNRRFGSHDKAQHDPVRIEDQGERWFFCDQAKVENIPVKVPGTLYVEDGDESDDVVGSKSCMLCHADMMRLAGKMSQECCCVILYLHCDKTEF